MFSGLRGAMPRENETSHKPNLVSTFHSNLIYEIDTKKTMLQRLVVDSKP